MFSKRKKRKDAQDGFDDVFVVSAAPSSYLGALTAETVSLPSGFQAWESAINDVVTAYLSGQVSRTAALQRLSDLHFADTAGIEWTLGVSSGQWYTRAPGTDWAAGAFPTLPTYDSPSLWQYEDAATPTDVAEPEPDIGTATPLWAAEDAADADLESLFEPEDTSSEGDLVPREGSADAGADALVAQVEEFANTGEVPPGGEITTDFPPPPPLPLPEQPWDRDYLTFGSVTPMVPPPDPDGADPA